MSEPAAREAIAASRRAVLIVNTRARSGAAAFEDARRRLAEKGFALEQCHAVDEPGRLTEVVARAAAERDALVVIGGGDGTISTALDALGGKDVTCGILPLGTANSFARSLNLPLDLQGAIDVLADGRALAVDLGRVNDRYFATALAIGLSPEIHRRKPHALKHLLGRLAYPMVASAVLPRFKPFACTLTVSSGECRSYASALEVRIANAPYEGGVEAAPDASLTSGDLVVHVVSGRSKWRLLKTWGKIVVGLEPDGPGYEELRGRTVTVETEPSLPVNVDGDAALQTPIEVSIARKALRVIVPRR